MWRWCLAVALVPAVLFVGGCSGQSSGYRELKPGDSFTTESGLTITVPPGASASVTTPRGEEIQTDVPFTQLVEVEVTNDLRLVFMSFDGTRRNKSDFRILGTSGSVTVFGTEGKTLPATVETDIPGEAAGRVVIMVPPGSSEMATGLALARTTWEMLSIEGADLP